MPQSYTDPNGVTGDLTFCRPNGRPLPEHKNWETWKAIPKDPDAPDVRRHRARHLATTTMLQTGVDRRVVVGLMGRSQAALLDAYQHILDELCQDAATRIESTFWSADPTPPEGVIDLAARRRWHNAQPEAPCSNGASPRRLREPTVKAMISSQEELDALPEGSVIKDARWRLLEKFAKPKRWRKRQPALWWSARSPKPITPELPALVILGG